MKEGKIYKSILVTVCLLLTVMASIFVPNVISDTTTGNSDPNYIRITEPNNNTAYTLNSEITINWVNDSDSGTTFWDTDYFLINISGPAFSGWVTVANITSPTATYNWDVSDDLTADDFGQYIINVTAYNSSTSCTPAPTHSVYILGTPGYNAWQGGNYTTTNGFRRDVITTDTSILKAGSIESITVNEDCPWENNVYYLYYPVYNGSLAETNLYKMAWERYSTGNTIQPNGDKVFEDVDLDRAGLWVIDKGSSGSSAITNVDFSGYSNYNSSVWAWFWVNTSTDYTWADIDDFYYNATDSFTIDIDDADGIDPTGTVMADIRYNTNGSSVEGTNVLAESGSEQFYKNNTYFWAVGNYTAYAYEDTDYKTEDNGLQYYKQSNMNDANKQYYNETYGTNADMNGIASWLTGSSAWNDKYNWTFAGPWDPPEHNVSVQTIQVKTSTPYTSVTNGTMYWGFDGEVNISLAETSGGSRFTPSDVTVYVFDDDDENVTSQFGALQNGLIDKTNAKSGGYIHINMSEWGKNNAGNSFADNGSWTAYIFVDINGDRDLAGANAEWTEEWNTTVEWQVDPGPAAQWKWIDDDGAVWDDANYDEVIPYIPGVANVPLDVEFKVYDASGNTFGDLASGTPVSVKECAENITISGNSLFTGTLDKFPGYGLSTAACGYVTATGVWHVPIIPTMSVGGGTIDIKVTAYNSTAEGTISIGGTNYGTNGSVVTVEPNNFKIDQENQTLTITVKNSVTGSDNLYGTAYLYYIDDGTITPANACKPITDHWVAYDGGTGGYTIPFNTTQQTTNQTNCGSDSANSFGAAKAPRNLTVYINGPFDHDDGYALIQMNPVNDFEVTISQETMMAGYAYDDFTISVEKTDNTSMNEDDKAQFHIKIIDENDDDVTDTLLNNIAATDLTNDADYSFSFDNVYATLAGTYRVYAYNNTHNSEGHNATLIVKAVEVTCDKSPFIWNSDNNISATFTITYEGNPVNGSLVIDNMTDAGAYNKTWANCSFDGSSDAAGENTSIKIKSNKIVNGVYTVSDITANHLDADESKQYITFWFKPTETSSVYAKAKARMEVQVPAVAPDPQYIPLGRTTKVYCTATGRGETLTDVFIRLHGQGFDQNSTTDVDGRVAFSVTPASTGNISIDVGETGRTLDDTVVYVVAWVIDASTDAEVNEGAQFTVTVVKEGTTDVVVGATVTIKGIGTDTTDSNGQATFTAPEVTSDRTYTIKVTKEGYAPDPDTNTITVINIPRLTIVVPDEVQATTTFEVAVADDTGSAIVGAIITFNEKTYTTGVNGIAKLTAPKTKGDYPITAIFGTYVEATGIVTVTAAPGIPGFELLSLIAALGVAFILFRRRRRR